MMAVQAHKQLFISRTKELQAFRKLLGRRSNEACGLYLLGPGGMGKTWLLHTMLDEASTKPDIVVVDKLIDMFANDMRLEEDVTDAIVANVRPTTSLPIYADYDKARDELRQALADKNFP